MHGAAPELLTSRCSNTVGQPVGFLPCQRPCLGQPLIPWFIARKVQPLPSMHLPQPLDDSILPSAARWKKTITIATAQVPVFTPQRGLNGANMPALICRCPFPTLNISHLRPLGDIDFLFIFSNPREHLYVCYCKLRLRHYYYFYGRIAVVDLAIAVA